MGELQDKAATAEEVIAVALPKVDELSAEAATLINALQDALVAAEARETEATERQRQAEEALATQQLELQRERHASANALNDLDTARADLRLSLRLQAMAQADLEALRERFAASEDARAAQESLLQRLTVRLRQAAAQLDLLHDDDLGDPESGDVRRLGRDAGGD